MKKLLFICCLLSLLFYSCSKRNNLPKGILPREKMQEVMWDMIRTGEFLDGFVLNKDSTLNKTAQSLKWYDKIYQVHGISKDQFIRSYYYYQAHPVLMKRILDSLGKKGMTNVDPTQQEQPLISPDTSNQQKPVLNGNVLIQDKLDSVKKLKRPHRLKVQ